MKENAPTVLAEWEACVDWHARFAADTDLGREAVRIVSVIRSRPGYRLGAVLLGRERNPERSDELDSVVSDVVRDVAPPSLLVRIDETLTEKPDAAGPTARFLLALAMKDPNYGKSLLALCDASEPSLDPYPLGFLIAGLHVSGADRTILRIAADRGGAWRRAASVAAARLRPAWYKDFSLSPEDLTLFRELANDPERQVWWHVVDTASFIVADAPDACLEIAKEAAARHQDEALEKVAEICRALLERDAAAYRTPVVALVEKHFTAAAQLDDYWTTHLLVRLAIGQLSWLLDFFDARIRVAENAKSAIPTLRPIPDLLDQALPGNAVKEPDFAAAVARVLNWATAGGVRAYEGGRLLRYLVGNQVGPVLEAAIVAGLTGAVNVEDLAQRIGPVLRSFVDNDEKFKVIFAVLDALPTPASGQADATRALVEAIGGGPIQGPVGQPPPAYVTLRARLQRFEAAHPGHLAVQAFVALAIERVDGRIAWHLEQDAEYRMR